MRCLEDLRAQLAVGALDRRRRHSEISIAPRHRRFRCRCGRIADRETISARLNGGSRMTGQHQALVQHSARHCRHCPTMSCPSGWPSRFCALASPSFQLPDPATLAAIPSAARCSSPRPYRAASLDTPAAPAVILITRPIRRATPVYILRVNSPQTR
jgi:hypothetical protein